MQTGDSVTISPKVNMGLEFVTNQDVGIIREIRNGMIFVEYPHYNKAFWVYEENIEKSWRNK